MSFIFKGRRIYLAGHTGLVGSALKRRLEREGTHLLLATHRELDLTRTAEVEKFLDLHRPELVINAAGRVGGIAANSKFPAEFIHTNLMIQTNLIHGAWKFGVRQFLNFGSGCMYPKESDRPMSPEMLLTGRMEPTSQPYALAKLAGAEMCAAYNRQHGTRYITAIPSNLYGPGDHFDTERSHVVSALIRRFHEAKKNGAKGVTLWGTGKATREFLFVDDLIDACLVLLALHKGDEPVNVGSGAVCSVAELAGHISRMMKFDGKLKWNRSKPDGADQKSLDSTVVRKLGWRPQTDLWTGLKQTYDWFLSKCES